MASFGVLHRNEESGALTGLTRVRRFQQDDAHLFCTPEQVMDEVAGALEFVGFVYKLLGLEFSLVLSTRPKKAIGTKEQWNKAEEALEKALNISGLKWGFNRGDGAFYGPKIDIRIKDSIGRMHQCGTIQLDFQLPMRFNLQFMSAKGEELQEQEKAAKLEAEKKAAEEKKAAGGGEKGKGKSKKEKKNSQTGAEEAAEGGNAQESDGKSAEQKAAEKLENLKNNGLCGKIKPGYERPVMIHRAIFGSVERFTAILCEHFGGKWPLFISPRQICVIPTHAGLNDYCKWVAAQYTNYGLFADADVSGKQMKKKIAVAQTDQYNYILVCGDKEKENLSVNIRDRDIGESIGDFSMAASLEKFANEANPNSKVANICEPFEGRMPEGTVLSAAPASANQSNQCTQGAQASITNSAGPGSKGGDSEKKDWEKHFGEYPYVEGYEASKADLGLLEKLVKTGEPGTPNLKRWFSHVQALQRENRI